MTDSVSADPRIGSVIAGYRVERLLGRGGMSVVYLAEHLRLKRKVALKLLAPELAADETFRERFLRESELAASLDHPNVIPIYDADEAGGVLFIAMRYVEGGDLAERLTGQGRLEPAEAVSLLGRVADALDAAHGLGLIHRDVKPGNVLISDAGHVYLSDFGLTRRSEDDAPLTESGQFVGTMDYVAPEQIESKGVSGQTDVYALSCVLFECLTGERPFRGDSTVGLLFAHLQNDPPSASQLDPELPSAIDPVLVRGMAKSPEARYPTCGELISEAQGALGLSGEIAQPVVASRWSRRRLLLVAAVLAAVVAVAAAVPAILLTGSGETSDVNAPTLELTGTSLQRIDAETNELAATIGFTRDPEDDSELRRPVAVDDEGAWVLLASDVLAEIDVSSNTVEGTADTRRSRLRRLASGASGTWVLAIDINGEPSVQRVERVGSLDPPIELGVSNPNGFDVGGDGVWVAADEIGGAKVVRVDAATDEIAAVIEVPGSPSELAAGPEAVWVTVRGREGDLVRIDPVSNEVVAVIEVGTSLTAVAAGEEGVWAGGGAGALVRIDPASNTVDLEVDIPGGVGELAVGENGVWVVPDFISDIAQAQNVVRRVDPVTGEVVASIQTGAGGATGGLAVGAGSAWVRVLP